MPIFQIDIEKKATAGAHTGEYWTNRYLITAGTLAEAAIFSGNIAAMEQELHTPAVLFTKAAVRDLDETTDLYSTIPLNTPGVYGGSIPADLLPAMLVVRVDLGVVTGRPSRKYYHLMLGEGSQSNGQWSSTVLSDVQGNINSLISAGGTAGQLCDPDGSTVISAAPMPIVTVHQFRRGSKRKLVPILP
jgi:hypothetical protein